MYFTTADRYVLVRNGTASEGIIVKGEDDTNLLAISTMQVDWCTSLPLHPGPAQFRDNKKKDAKVAKFCGSDENLTIPRIWVEHKNVNKPRQSGKLSRINSMTAVVALPGFAYDLLPNLNSGNR